MTQLLEHEGKRLLADAGVAVPAGEVVRTADDALAAAGRIGARVAVKVQIPSGGRGKAGGIKLVDAADAGDAAAGLLGAEVKGFPVECVLIEEAVASTTELYLGVTVDPRSGSPVLLVGAAGGVDVESGADQIARVPFPLSSGLRPAHVWQAADAAGIAPERAARMVPVARAAAAVFAAQRAQLVEINPLVEQDGGDELIAADVRVIPDTALVGQTSATEVEAASRALGFDYVVLDPEGDVGLLTTGAGASMMLIDLLQSAGLRPANFCDVRTGSLRGDPTKIEFVLDQLVAAGVKAITVNVFAGITDLDEVATLLLASLQSRAVTIPVIVRFEGRGAAEARTRLAEHGVRTATSPEELVSLAAATVAAANEGESR